MPAADGVRRRLPHSEDVVATATAFTAASIADAYRRFVFPRLKTVELARLQIVLGGGGAKNPTLRRMLAERIGVGELLTHEDFGIANSAKEALAFAILAHETLRGRPGNVPSATGARRAVVLGKIVPGSPEAVQHNHRRTQINPDEKWSEPTSHMPRIRSPGGDPSRSRPGLKPGARNVCSFGSICGYLLRRED